MEGPGAAEAAVLLLGHGTTKGWGAVANLRRHAARLARVPGFGDVHVATLHGPGPRPPEVIRRVRRRELFVVPVTMCDGQTVGDVSALVGDGYRTRLRFCPPLGAHPDLAELIARRTGAAATGLGWPPEGTTVLLVAHGSSRHPASARGAHRLAALVQVRCAATRVAVAFLEQKPTLADALVRLRGPLLVVGLFAGGGRHATDDVDDAVAASGRTNIVHLGAIGTDAAIASVIAAIVHESCSPPALAMRVGE
ncbi:MAG: CbiX/SirB N-terminal domain-containing protein [Rhodospirillales bacterium]